jgi:hypothetical protein
MEMIATARGLQRKAADLPLTRAPRPEEGGIAAEHFADVNRELRWGLTLNK